MGSIEEDRAEMRFVNNNRAPQALKINGFPKPSERRETFMGRMRVGDGFSRLDQKRNPTQDVKVS